MNPNRPRFVVALPWTLALISAVFFGFAQRTKPAQARALGFAERVAYQRAIEEVYWRHRIWPNERTESKPSLDRVMSQAQIEKKVIDYLRNSRLLEDYWQRALTAEQLQAEMDRMAQHTKQPEVLRELFAALGNDPFVIAECLVRPALAERLVTSWYAYDERFHGALKQRAQAELQAHPTVEQMKGAGANYVEIEFIRSDNTSDESDAGRPAIKLTSDEWNETIRKLTPAKAGVFSSLQEDESGYHTAAIIEKTAGRLRLATVSWSKEPFASWRDRSQAQLLGSRSAPTIEYSLPAVPDTPNSCADDTWTATSGPPENRQYHTAVWTGSEMIVWGGEDYSNFVFNSGGRYNPSTDSWTATTTTNAPTPRYSHIAVWTGSEMIVWGGLDSSGIVNTGGRYNPGTDAWTPTSTTNSPTARDLHTGVWTGSEMIVWGGFDSGGDTNTGGRYNANTDSWTSTSTTNAPAGRESHSAIWSGSKIVIWGGSAGVTLNTGGIYDPATNSWTATSTTGAPAKRLHHTAIWTGSEMIVWGGDSGGTPFNTGGRYNVSTNSWTATGTTNAPEGRQFHTAVWTGNEMIVWGGFGNSSYLNTGGKYNPGANSWTGTATTNAPTGRASHSAVWSGTEMIIWGGADTNEENTGARYNPSADSWIVTGKTPINRARHTAVWTGTEMIVWGGFLQDGSAYLNTGGNYNPSTDSWTTTSVINAPDGRYLHTGVWSGTEMIVWGGYFFDTSSHYLNTGGRYNPATNSWAATSTTNVPNGRYFHTAVWSGTEMIVWGGYFFDTSDHYLNNGGRYNPGTDSWTATATVNAPSRRDAHKAVWTGSEMIVWGGFDGSSYLGTGGKYNPSANSWTATSTINAPTGRTTHAEVWTGSEMIVWGGSDAINYLDTGARYNPTADTWTTTSSINAPSARLVYGPVWTGDKMILWGGYDGVNYLGDGGKYDPVTDSWTATSLINAPAGRYRHTGVWTGDEMIVWGGILSFNTYTNTGGRYCAQSGAPTPTPTPTATPTATPTPTPTPMPTRVKVNVAVAPTQINEGQSATYTVTATAAVSQSLTVNYAMSGTATLNTDYSLSGTAGQVTILTGQTSATVKLKAKTDASTEGTETAIMTLQPGNGYKVGQNSQATVSILDGP
jgi:N-acetylneuraminic acid mutarotase